MTEPEPGRGLRSVTGEEFNLLAAVGGVRGLVEAVLPGLVFVVVFVPTANLAASLIASSAVALLAVAWRLFQRTEVTQALSGIAGIAIGVIWAWRSGEAQNFFAPGLWTNGAYLVAVLISLAVRWPAVGLVVELLRAGLMDRGRAEPDPVEPTEQPRSDNPFAGLSQFRRDPNLMRRYTLATWLWVALFAVRLAVQLPLFFNEAVGWLGTARLVLGVPLWGLVLYLTWALINGSRRRRE